MKQCSTCIGNERGSALIAVLCLLFTAGLLTTATLSLSKSGTFTVATHVALQRSMLIAEGAATRIQYLIAADRSVNGTADALGATKYEEYDSDRFLPDGITHEINYYGERIAFTITDAVSGWDLSESGYEETLSIFAAEEDLTDDEQQLISDLKNRIKDYIDTDDDVETESQESADYDESGAWPLPRNAAMEYREELTYIRDFRQLFPYDRNGRLTSVRLIPPPDTVDLGGMPSLMNADRKMLRLYCGLEEDEIEEVLEALGKWRSEREPLSDNLSEELAAKLSGLSQENSNIYSVVISTPAGSGKIFRRLYFTYCPFDTAGPERQNVQYLEWFFQ